MAFSRFTTKVKQTVTNAEKTTIDPTLKESVRQFDETKIFGDKIRDAAKEALPIITNMGGKMTKIENLGALIKQAAAKYGTEKPEAAGLLHGGEIMMAIGKHERALLSRVDTTVYTLIKETHDFNESLKKAKSQLENRATDMDGARMKLKSSQKEDLKSKAQDSQQKYEAQLASVEEMVAKLPEHRDKQRQAVKLLLEAQCEFHKHAVGTIENMIAQCG